MPFSFRTVDGHVTCTDSIHRVCFRALILDLDGFLVDSEFLPKCFWAAFYRKLVAEQKIACPAPVGLETFYVFNGRAPAEIEALGVEIFGSLENFRAAKFHRDQATKAIWETLGLDCKAGACALLQRAREAQLSPFIVSASSNQQLRWKLEKAGLRECFDDARLIGADHARNKFELFQRAIQLAGVAPEECLIGGDAPPDAEFGLRAGAHVFIVPDLCDTAEFAPFSDADRFLGIFPSLSEVTNLLELTDR